MKNGPQRGQKSLGPFLLLTASAALRVRRAAGGCASGIGAGASYREVQGVVVRHKLFHLFRGLMHNVAVQVAVVVE
jgi:hypothetical protein